MVWRENTTSISFLPKLTVLEPELKKGNQFIDLEKQEVSKSYDNQLVLDAEHTIVVDLTDKEYHPGDTVTVTPDLAGNWEVIALYTVPSCSIPIRGIYDKSYVVDHMDAKQYNDYVNDWLGNPEGLQPIIEKYGDSIRAGFNDSYEFYDDMLYNNNLYTEAKNPDNLIGYDISKYIPAMYQLSR